MQKLEDIKKRTEWFLDARFGMFIHFGLYAIPARGEWVRNREKTTLEDYQKYFDHFNPVDFDAREWVKIAKDAGMKYIVLTAKHHDGFCLFDSQYTEYKSTNTPFARDLIREFLEAARAEDIKVGLYYSLLDWQHEDYPKYEDWHHPMRGVETFKDEKIDFDNYLDYMHKQVEELMRDYGKIDIIWFDFSYDKMSGETWHASKFIEMVRSYQPNIIINNRLEGSGEGFGSIVSDNISDYAGDFVSPEQALPFEGIRNINGELLPWELCLTMNYNWGYSANDLTYKNSKQLIRKLVECVSKGGNMLLNVGPDARGKFPAESVKILREMGEWMKLNSESIHNCGMANLDKPEWGYYTKSEHYLYAHVFDQSIGPLPLIGLEKDEIEFVDKLADFSEINISESWTIKEYDEIFVDIPENLCSRDVNSDMDTVLRIKLK